MRRAGSSLPLVLFGVLGLLVARPAGVRAEELRLGGAALDVHGFVSQGFIFTTENDFLAESSEGSFEMSEVGINFTMPLTDRLRTGVQLFARDLGRIGNYNAKVDWFYLDYRWHDWLGIRAGRVKLPFGLYNEFSDIDAARAPVLLPQSVYPTQNRDFLLAQTGAELYGYVRLGAAGALDYRLYGGTIFVEAESAPGSPAVIARTNIPYAAGARLLWETPLEGLRLGASVLAGTLEVDVLVGQELVLLEAPTVQWLASVELVHDELLLAAEYGRWFSEVESSNTEIFPEDEGASDRMYAMAAYRLNAIVLPSVYYAVYFPDVDDRSGRDRQQHDLAATLRLDLNDHWLLKLEGHYMRGTAGLDAALNGKPLTMLEESWVLFLAKTTVYF